MILKKILGFIFYFSVIINTKGNTHIQLHSNKIDLIIQSRMEEKITRNQTVLDSLSTQIELYSNKIDSIIESRMQEEITRNQIILDSLSTQVYRYKLNENYFSTALSNQTAIFSLIVTALFLLIGYISFSKFKSEVKKVKKKYQQSIKNYNLMEKRFASSDSDLYGSLALIFLNLKKHGVAIFFALKGISHANLDNTTKKTLIDNIKYINNLCKKELDSEQIKYLKENKEEIMVFFHNLTCIQDDDIQKEIAELRIEFTNKINNS